jgi:hypothetical protein
MYMTFVPAGFTSSTSMTRQLPELTNTFQPCSGFVATLVAINRKSEACIATPSISIFLYLVAAPYPATVIVLPASETTPVAGSISSPVVYEKVIACPFDLSRLSSGLL